MKHTKIAIIGAGAVGSTTAYAIMYANIAAEIILVDIDEIRCRGEVLDLSDALSFCETSRIQSGTAQDAAQADIIIIAAGARQKPGQSRQELITTNQKVVARILESLTPLGDDTILLMVSNPVDTLTLYAQECARILPSRIFGSGTFLDTQRLRGNIARTVGCAEESVNAYILGEHGDTQFPAWSCATIDGVPLSSFDQLTPNVLEKLAQETREKAYEIIACKEATYYGIASCVAEICTAIVLDQKRILPLSTYVESLGVCLSIPVIVGEKGIERTLDLPLNPEEQELLEKSGKHLREVRKMCD